MILRKWQNECVNLAFDLYLAGNNHFLTLATPGAGKTFMASALADKLLKNDLIDLIICFSPSSIIAKDFSESLHIKIQARFDGLMGARGHSLTYQSLQFLNDDFWQLFSTHRVFVIFDEIHHCAGSTIDNANAWGEKIILNIQNKAAYTLALTGTPWRSDTAPIVLSTYMHPSNKICCDYVYGLAEAINDKVCRVPQIIAVDNDNISVVDEEEAKSFSSFKMLLSESIIPYQEIIENEEVINYLVSSAHEKLTSIRKDNPSAAGLIVTSSVEHASNVAKLLKAWLNEDATLVTYKESDSASIIQRFRAASSKWIISVGMISEGTNIPRLQVCCHLTNIKTEMHFRQILGRILRMTDSVNQDAVFYMPAEPKLLEYACRVKEDVPFEADVVKFEKMKSEIECDVSDKVKKDSIADAVKSKIPAYDIGLSQFDDIDVTPVSVEKNEFEDAHYLASSYDKEVNVWGRFKQEAIALGLSELG